MEQVKIEKESKIEHPAHVGVKIEQESKIEHPDHVGIKLEQELKIEHAPDQVKKKKRSYGYMTEDGVFKKTKRPEVLSKEFKNAISVARALIPKGAILSGTVDLGDDSDDIYEFRYTNY